jgi:hypothetical protein
VDSELLSANFSENRKSTGSNQGDGLHGRKKLVTPSVISQAESEGPPGGLKVPHRGMVSAPSGNIRSFLMPEVRGLEMFSSTATELHNLKLN